jgi:Bifunctional DNA primase/polymerase, N-terminal
MKLKIIKKYLDLGFSIFPVKRKEKTPATANGFKDATNSLDQIKIWERDIYLNVGIATGLKSGISVVDVDPDSGGSESLKKLVTEHGLDIDTFTVKTPRGGIHLYYSDKIGAKTRTAVLPGIDIRGDGGYVVAPPSLHPNGINYDFAVNDFESMRREEFLSKLKVFPSEIIDLVGRKNKKTSIPNEGNVTEGNRFEHLRTQIGKLRRSGISRESARIYYKMKTS